MDRANGSRSVVSSITSDQNLLSLVNHCLGWPLILSDDHRNMKTKTKIKLWSRISVDFLLQFLSHAYSKNSICM